MKETEHSGPEELPFFVRPRIFVVGFVALPIEIFCRYDVVGVGVRLVYSERGGCRAGIGEMIFSLRCVSCRRGGGGEGVTAESESWVRSVDG